MAGKLRSTREISKREKGFGLFWYGEADVSGDALPADALPGAVIKVATSGGGTVGGITVADDDKFVVLHDGTCEMLHDNSDT